MGGRSEGEPKDKVEGHDAKYTRERRIWIRNVRDRYGKKIVIGEK